MSTQAQVHHTTIPLYLKEPCTPPANKTSISVWPSSVCTSMCICSKAPFTILSVPPYFQTCKVKKYIYIKKINKSLKRFTETRCCNLRTMIILWVLTHEDIINTSPKNSDVQWNLAFRHLWHYPLLAITRCDSHQPSYFTPVTTNTLWNLKLSTWYDSNDKTSRHCHHQLCHSSQASTVTATAPGNTSETIRTPQTDKTARMSL